MNKGFWGKLQPPVLALAPMADVTDAVFRRIIAKYSRMGEEGGGPSVMWSEFVSADGLVLAPEEGKKKLLKDLIFTEKERPIVAQFFTSKPEMMRHASLLARELGFDGVDINMGCPDRSIEKQGAGAALMKAPHELIHELISAAKEGAGDLPVSVKTRIGYKDDEIDTWIPAVLKAEPAALTVHFRTRREMSKVPAHWELAPKVVELRDKISPSTMLLGNGDVVTLADAKKKVSESGMDGVMMGKAIFGNPWLFDEEKSEVSINEKLEVLVEHTKLFEELLGDTKNFAIMKKHYKAYVNGFPCLPAGRDGAKELRMKLMEARGASEVEEIVGNFLEKRH